MFRSFVSLRSPIWVSKQIGPSFLFSKLLSCPGNKCNNNCFFQSVPRILPSFITPTLKARSVLRPWAIFTVTDRKNSYYCININFSVEQPLFSHVNTLTTNYEYSHSNRKNLPLPIQLQLSKKWKIFCRNFIAFLESASNFEHFGKKINK